MNRIFALAAVFILPFISHAAGQTWTIGNAEIERTLVFDGSGLFTQSLSDLKTGAHFIHPDSIPKELSPEFSFDCDGHVYSGHSAEFTLLGSDESTQANGKALTVRLRARHVPMDVTVVYHVYTGHPAVRKYLLLKNTGSTPLHLSHLDLEGIGPSVGPADETILNAQYGTAPRHPSVRRTKRFSMRNMEPRRARSFIPAVPKMPPCWFRMDAPESASR